MAYFNHICLVEAPQTIIAPFPRFITDCIGVCYLAAAVEHDVETLVMPENYYNAGIFDSMRALRKKKTGTNGCHLLHDRRLQPGRTPCQNS